MARIKPNLSRPPPPLPTPPPTPVEAIGSLSPSELEKLLIEPRPDQRRVWLAIAALHPTLIMPVYQAICTACLGAVQSEVHSERGVQSEVHSERGVKSMRPVQSETSGQLVETLSELIEMVPAASGQGLAVWRQAWPNQREAMPAWIETLMALGRRHSAWHSDLIMSIVRRLTLLEEEASLDDVDGNAGLDACMVAMMTQLSLNDLEPLLQAFSQFLLPRRTTNLHWLLWPLLPAAQDRLCGHLLGCLIGEEEASAPLAPMALTYLRHLPHLTPKLVDACLVCLFHWLEAAGGKDSLLTPVLATLLTLLPQGAKTASAGADGIPQASSGANWTTRLHGLLAGKPQLRRSLPKAQLTAQLELIGELPPSPPSRGAFVDFNPWRLPPPANLPRLTQLLLKSD